ncbi:nucleotide-binding protein [Pseudomonas sp.]|uniref:nucleotide-binding protein n=1 Tax=Pseudomonas sp. TaxID=306 RepID=UPI003FD8FC84
MDTKGRGKSRKASQSPQQAVQSPLATQEGKSQPLPRAKSQQEDHQSSSTIQTATILKASSNPIRSNNFMKNNVHITLQGKGGVGKSFVSALLVQYLRSKGVPVTAIDTDPVNATLAGYKSFGTQRLELMEGGTVVERNFDKLIEQIVEEDTSFVIDNGASSFIPLSYYIAENDAFSIIAEHKKQVIIHTVITGGQAIRDTLKGLKTIIEQLPGEAKLVVWLNEFFGDIEIEGKTFEELQIYTNNKERISGIIRIARQTGSTFGEDVKLMLDRKLTFDEVNQSPDFKLMSKSRLTKVKNAIFEQLAVVL